HNVLSHKQNNDSNRNLDVSSPRSSHTSTSSPPTHASRLAVRRDERKQDDDDDDDDDEEDEENGENGENREDGDCDDNNGSTDVQTEVKRTIDDVLSELTLKYGTDKVNVQSFWNMVDDM
ncbi:hypothetical protein RFI_33484, partial [Reticulomyxa filosa]